MDIFVRKSANPFLDSLSTCRSGGHVAVIPISGPAEILARYGNLHFEARVSFEMRPGSRGRYFPPPRVKFDAPSVLWRILSVSYQTESPCPRFGTAAADRRV